ncbi:Oxygen tolerance [Paraburkholderia fungorum]|uniref:Oxygen tolerance n=1 Tax=Paraburkholderia fungorum TaxID=134537 RepID=A0A1H1JJP0_9BURK|nr:BatD family protein [Paraburkholderia fungorum]SDR50213.1 Oxygen tolerance [Paraburkholderia fungorum]
MISRFVAILFACMLMSTAAHADDAPRTMLRAHLEPAGPVVAGSAVKLVVDTLTTTYFSEAPDWPLFDLHDAFVTLPDDSGQNLNETIDGVRWFGVSREYQIVPRAAGTFEVPSFRITLHPGGSDTPVTLETPTLSFSATLPPGAENMATFFPAPKLTATQVVEPKDGRLEVGGTITRIITQRAEATAPMLIPPLAFGDVDGLRRYAKAPATRVISDGRGGLIAGERVDTVAYVVNRRGHYTLPPIDIEWWNTATKQREMVHLPAVTFTARAAQEKPLWAIPADALAGAARHTVIFLSARDLVLAGVVLACIVAVVAFYSRMRGWVELLSRWWSARRKRRAQGEFAAWRGLRTAVESGAMQRIVPALYRWIDASPRFARPARVAMIDDPQLKPLADAVQQHYTQRTTNTPHVRLDFRRIRPRARKQKRDALPPLNER